MHAKDAIGTAQNVTL